MNEKSLKTVGIDEAIPLVPTMVNKGEFDQAQALVKQLRTAARHHPDVLCVSESLL